MNRLSATTWIASLGLHGLLLLPLVSFAASGPREIYDDGTGNDAFRLEQGITIDMVSFGDAAERVEIAEVAPIIANPIPPPVVETKPVEPELKDVITASQSATETIKTTEEPPPVEQPKPQEVAIQNQAAQVAVLTEKSAGLAQDGGKAQARDAYAGKIYGALKKVPSRRWGAGEGRVVISILVDDKGRVTSRQIVESSGIAAVDAAAIDMIDRAKFPPLPEIFDKGEAFNVPLRLEHKKQAS